MASGVDPSLGASRRLLDPQLGDAGLDGLGHPADLFHLDQVLLGPDRQVVGESLHVVTAGPRIGYPTRTALLLEEQLGVPSDAGRKVGRKGQRLVQGVGV